MALRPGYDAYGRSEMSILGEGGRFCPVQDYKSQRKSTTYGPLEGLFQNFREELSRVESDLWKRKQEQLRIAQEQYRVANAEAEAKRTERRLEREKEKLQRQRRNDEILRRHRAGETMKSIATNFGISSTRVQQIVLKAMRTTRPVLDPLIKTKTRKQPIA